MATFQVNLQNNVLTVESETPAKDIISQMEKGKVVTVMVGTERRHYNAAMVVCINDDGSTAEPAKEEPEDKAAEPVPEVPAKK